MEAFPESYFNGCEAPLSDFELVEEEFDKQDDISVSIENSMRLEFEPGDTDVDVSKKLVATKWQKLLFNLKSRVIYTV